MSVLVPAPATPAPPLPACPDCGGATYRDVVLIGTPGLDGYGRAVEIKRLGRVTACGGCEWTVEGNGPSTV